MIVRVPVGTQVFDAATRRVAATTLRKMASAGSPRAAVAAVSAILTSPLRPIARRVIIRREAPAKSASYSLN